MPKNKRFAPDDINVGERIKARRLLLGMSQAALADKCGITFQQIQKYEKGTNGLRLGRMKLVAAALGVPPLYFLGEESVVGQSNLKLLLTPTAVHLLQAFDKIERGGVRSAVVALVEKLATTEKVVTTRKRA